MTNFTIQFFSVKIRKASTAINYTFFWSNLTTSLRRLIRPLGLLRAGVGGLALVVIMRQQPERADVVLVQALDFQVEDGMHPGQAL